MSTSRIWGAACGLLLSQLATIAAAQQASVLVEVVPLAKATLRDTLTGYGIVVPDAGGLTALSVARPVRVSRLAVSVGQIVKRGTPLIEIESDPASISAYEQALSTVALARSELARTRSLRAQQLATESQVAAASKALSDAQTVLAAQRQLGADRARETLTAAFDGVVFAVAVAQGDRVQPGAPLLQLARLDALRVALGIEPSDSAKLKVGMPIRLTSVQDSAVSIDTSVTQTPGMINPQTQLIDVVVRLPAKVTAGLLPGTRVKGVITLATRTTWAVPRDAVLHDAQGDYLYQVAAGTALRVNVKAGIESDGLVGVDGKLDPALPVVILGNYELRNGMPVRAQKK
ncbi:MAG TPA: efflux RND transporter periplasmic adaptor subunit [Burkholderiales bacterium]|nr:efflux RND transporter periplasmic adaptor subunit [Burkholderiales bacterium]